MSDDLVINPVFLSSLSGDPETGCSDSSPLLQLRLQIKADNPRGVWVAEVGNDGLKNLPSLKIVDACIDRIKASSLVLILLGEKRDGKRPAGTPVNVEGLESLVSYFEIEVFQAALHNKPVVVLQMNDYFPPPRMREFLKLMSAGSVVQRWERGVSYDEARRIAAGIIVKANGTQHIRTGIIGPLVAQIANVRGRLGAARRGNADVLWLNGNFITSADHRTASLSNARFLFDGAKGEFATSSLLSRLYLAAAELMRIAPLGEADLKTLELWSDVLGKWGSSAAWYGLHNHLGTGVLATLGTRQEILRSIARLKDEPIAEIPLAGAMASAYYSEGKKCPRGWTKVNLLMTGLHLANRDVRNPLRDHPGIFAVRGCLRASLGHIPGAFYDFKTLHREASALGDLKATAEGLSYLGRYYSLVRMNRKAEAYLEEAVLLHKTSDEAEFEKAPLVAKALKNLISHYHSRGQTSKRNNALEELRSVCTKYEIRDQLEQAEAIVAG